MVSRRSLSTRQASFRPMRAAALLLLVLAVPPAGGIGFREVEGGPTATCGEGCIALEPGESAIRILPREGAVVAWSVEDALGLPLADGLARTATMLELPAGAARVRITVA